MWLTQWFHVSIICSLLSICNTLSLACQSVSRTLQNRATWNAQNWTKFVTLHWTLNRGSIWWEIIKMAPWGKCIKSLQLFYLLALLVLLLGWVSLALIFKSILFNKIRKPQDWFLWIWFKRHYLKSWSQ